jgi:CheY-like chemotaxis protein/anti-sigma regulatory factor (Ser/Thr protein kinase)
MPKILVVDDSPVDRRLVGGLAGKLPGALVQYAVDGADAMVQIESDPPDLLITDLIMPEMSGLELVARVRRSYPHIPVILMTSQGNEDIAVEALQKGASSYVSKYMLAHRLQETIDGVLAASSKARSQVRLLGCRVSSTHSFLLENDSSLFPPLLAYVQEEARQLALWDETEQIRVGIALQESLANALYHGNLELPSQMLEGDDGAFYREAEDRRCRPPYRDRRIHVEAGLSRRAAQFVVRDEGPGFDPAALPDPTDPANLEKVSGRGILLMRTFMNEVVYNEQGNTVTLVKYASATS